MIKDLSICNFFKYRKIYKPQTIGQESNFDFSSIADFYLNWFCNFHHQDH